jgi:hypothetical protein
MQLALLNVFILLVFARK